MAPSVERLLAELDRLLGDLGTTGVEHAEVIDEWFEPERGVLSCSHLR